MHVRTTGLEVYTSEIHVWQMIGKKAAKITALRLNLSIFPVLHYPGNQLHAVHHNNKMYAKSCEPDGRRRQMLT